MREYIISDLCLSNKMNLTALVTDSRKLTYILGGSIALMVFIAFIFVLTSSFDSTTTTSAELTVWGVFDDQSVLNESINAFQKANKSIRVSYKLFAVQDYEQAVLNALAAGTGPDVWMIHNTWLVRHMDKLIAMPAAAPGQKVPLVTVRQFQDAFVDVAEHDLVVGDKIYGMPLYVDTLALYYNKDTFASVGIAQPPKLWIDFIADVKKITIYDESRNITRSAAALGTARNINRSTDILMMLMLQSGVQMTDKDRAQSIFSRPVDGIPVGENAVQFYTDFANPSSKVYTWNDTLDYSFDAFVAGKTAMMVNYAHQISALRKAAPRLNWAVAPIPQASSVDVRTYASYWPLVVSAKTKSPNEAWLFVAYMTAGDGAKPYLNASGRPAARRDLIDQQKNDPDVGVFAEQALAARSWLQIDNVAIEKIFTDMIDNINLGKQTLMDALRAADAKVSVLMAGR